MPQLGAAGPYRPHQQSLPCWRSLNPLFRRAGSIAPPLGPPGTAGVEHWDGAVRCVSVDLVLSGCVSRWVESSSSTRLGGFRALKKTTEAPYTTKVNNRGRTSRGTTRKYNPRIGSYNPLQNAKSRFLECRNANGDNPT